MGTAFNRNRLLVRSNIRKAKGQMIAIIVLVLLSSLMMNLWLMLATDYKKNFERSHDLLNDGHVTLAAYTDDTGFRDFLTRTFKNSEDVTEYSLIDALCSPGSYPYGNGEIMAEFIMLEKESALSREVGKFEIIEEGEFQSGIYLPMICGTGDNYSVGDKIELTFGSETYEYTVCGFFNSTMAGTHNCGLLAFLLTEDKYEELSEKGGIPRSTYASIRIQDKTEAEVFEAFLKDEISGEYPGLYMVNNYYESVTTARYISQMICAGIMSVMAFLVLLIGVVVISSNVVNYIQENMQNLGALKAVGYTSRQLVSALLMQFSGISALTAAIGSVLSYCIFPAVNEMMVAQTGIPYRMKFLPIPFLATVLFIWAVVAAAVELSAKGLKKIEPITAIRQGVATHSFRKNHVPLEKTFLPLLPAMGIKNAFSGLKANITTCITILVISFILVFSGVMFENVIMDMQPFIDMIAGESADSCININVSREEEFLEAMNEDERVEKIYLYSNNSEIQHVGGFSLVGIISDDFSKVNNQSVIIEGRFPIYHNEIAIAAKYAKEQGLLVGDEIELKTEGREQTYLITGFVQTSNNIGKDCALTREGYEKIGTYQNAGYYLNLKPGTDIDAFNEEAAKRFGNDINAMINIHAIIEGSGSVYVSLMTVIVVVVLVLSCIVICFVLYLLVRTLLNSKKRDYGILKALGYTTGQLVLQTAMSFMPAVILSTAVGIFAGMKLINPILALFLGGIGIVKCTFSVPVGFNIAAGIGLVVFAFGAACLMSLRVRRITPRALLAGE